MKETVLIFDFDGTIADTHKYVCDISNSLCEEFNYKPIKFEDLPQMKGLTAQEMIKYLDVPLLKIPAIVSRAKKEFYKNLSSLKMFDHLREVLGQLKVSANGIGILSSNSQENVTQFLKNNNIDIFDFIQTTSKVWSKNTSLKKLIVKQGFELGDIIYIGDETRDIAAARKLGIKIASVTWGYNSVEVLSKHKPDYIFNTPQELLTLC